MTGDDRVVEPPRPGSGSNAAFQQLQQTGMLFIIMQQVQPAFIMAVMQSQQAWIMAQQSVSPLVQVMRTPSSVISHLHMPIVRLQQQTIMPFIIMQQLHMPPAIIVQRFCIMPADILSSQVQVIFMPPVHFSIVIVQRGTIIMFVPAGIVPGAAHRPHAHALGAHARHAHPRPLHHHRVGHLGPSSSSNSACGGPGEQARIVGTIMPIEAVISTDNQSENIAGIMITKRPKMPGLVIIAAGDPGTPAARGRGDPVAPECILSAEERKTICQMVTKPIIFVEIERTGDSIASLESDDHADPEIPRPLGRLHPVRSRGGGPHVRRFRRVSPGDLRLTRATSAGGPRNSTDWPMSRRGTPCVPLAMYATCLQA